MMNNLITAQQRSYLL